MKVQLVAPYRVSLLQRYGVTVRGNVTSVYPPLVPVPCHEGKQSITGGTSALDVTKGSASHLCCFTPWQSIPGTYRIEAGLYFRMKVNNIESPTRCNNNDLLISKISTTCFGQLFAHLQERKTEIHSMWHSVLML